MGATGILSDAGLPVNCLVHAREMTRECQKTPGDSSMVSPSQITCNSVLTIKAAEVAGGKQGELRNKAAPSSSLFPYTARGFVSALKENR